MKKLIPLILLLVLVGSGCKKLRHKSFSIRAIEVQKVPSNADFSNEFFIACEGPGMNDVTNIRGNWGTTIPFSQIAIEGDKARQDYTFTLVEKEGSQETDLSELTVDFGKNVGEDEFVASNDDMRLRFTVEWETRW
ncbi:MAG: hypothetical protein ACPGED_01390 [Flavobacteriales bacterium]